MKKNIVGFIVGTALNLYVTYAIRHAISTELKFIFRNVIIQLVSFLLYSACFIIVV